MENIQQEFLDEAVLKIENILLELSNENLTEDFRREIFRTFHTLKGSSQTLGFPATGKFTHELENLLQAISENKDHKNENLVSLLKEGTELLLENLRHARKSQIFFPQEFVEKLYKNLPVEYFSDTDFSPNEFPPDVFNKLSVHEKISLREAVFEGKNLYVTEVEFSLSNFDEKFRLLHKILQNTGKIIASFPKTNVPDPTKIGFRIYFASLENPDEIYQSIKPFDAELNHLNPHKSFSGDLKGILEQAVFQGKKLSQRLNKNIEFEIKTNTVDVSNDPAKLLPEILLHLIRNAVDHAIKKEGKIKIEAESAGDDLILRVTDNGSGLDTEKILAKAIEKNLVAANTDLSSREIYDLIFSHGFSTAERISEISGRGVGLDVVRDAVEKAGGKIRIESASNQGTGFEIRLPYKK